MSETATYGWTITRIVGRRFRMTRTDKSHTNQPTNMTLCGRHLGHGWQGLTPETSGARSASDLGDLLASTGTNAGK